MSAVHTRQISEELREQILAAPPGETNTAIASRLGVHRNTVSRVRREGRLERRQRASEILEQRIEAIMPAHEVLERLAQIARASIADLVKASPEGWTLDLEKAAQSGALALVEELGYTSGGPKVRMYSKLDALVHLGRYWGLFQERPEVTEDAVEELLGRLPAELAAQIGELLAAYAAGEDAVPGGEEVERPGEGD